MSGFERPQFPDFDQKAMLPEGQEVTLEFTHEVPGEYDFQFQRGTFYGNMIEE